MIIQFFKKSYLPQLLALVLLVIVLWLPEIFFFSQNFSTTQTGFIPINSWIRQPLAILLFIIISLIVNKLSTKHHLSLRNSYLTAFFFILIGSATVFMTKMSTFLAATFFFALFYQKVFDLQNSTKVITTTFDAGLYLGLVSLFFPPAMLLLIFVWFALLIYQADQWRAYVTAIIGILLPWFFIFVGYFWFDKLPEALPEFLKYFHFREIWNPIHDKPDLAIFLMVALTTLIGVLSLLGGLSSYNISQRQHILVNLWGLLFSSLVVFLLAVPMQALYITAVPASLILGTFFSQMKRLKWANLFVLLWILSIFINQYLPLFYAA